MGMLILLNLLRKELILLLLLSFGVGAEIYLIGFQITNEVYCYYCLAFEAIIALLFLLNLKMSQGSIAGILIFAEKGSNVLAIYKQVGIIIVR